MAPTAPAISPQSGPKAIAVTKVAKCEKSKVTCGCSGVKRLDKKDKRLPNMPAAMAANTFFILSLRMKVKAASFTVNNLQMISVSLFVYICFQDSPVSITGEPTPNTCTTC